MKRKKKTGTGGRGAGKGNGQKLAGLLTASLVMSPVLYSLLPVPVSVYAEPAPVVTGKLPYMKNPLPDFKTGAAQPLTLDLSQYFEGAAAYASSVSNLQGAGASISGNLFTLSSERTGTATVTITGSAAGMQSVTDTFDVTVVPASIDRDNNSSIDIGEIAAYLGSHPTDRAGLNELLQIIAPRAALAPNTPPKPRDASFTVNTNASITVSPDQLFEDIDNNALTLETWSLSTSGNVSVSLSGNQLTLTGLQPGLLKLIASVNDGSGGRASNAYSLSVLDSAGGTNHAPLWNGSLSTVTVTQNTYATINLNTAFTDLDGDALQFDPVTVQPSGSFIQIEQSQGYLQIYGLASGTSTVTASVYDGRGGAASASFDVLVNRAPVAGVIDPQSTTAGYPIYLSPWQYFTDPDGDTLTFTASSSTAGIVTTGFSSGLLQLSPAGVGTTTVTLTATDSHGASSSIQFGVSVQNTAPAYISGSLASQYVNPDAPLPATISLIEAFADPDNEPLTYSALSNDNDLVTVNVTGSQLALYPAATGHGTTTVLVTADDSHPGGTAATSFNVTVNRPPVRIGDPTPPKVINAGTHALITVSTLFQDGDNDPLTYTAATADGATYEVSTYETANMTMAQIGGLPAGTNTVTLRADDNYGGFATDTFEVTVNSQPVINADLPLIQVPATDPQTVITLSAGDYATDADGDALSFDSVDGFNSQIIDAYIDGNELKIQGLAAGSTAISFTIIDSRGGTTFGSVDVEVSTPPLFDIPFTKRILAAEGEPISFYPANYAFDEDFDELTFTAVSSNSGSVVVYAGEFPGEFEIFGTSAGTSTVTVTADDQHGNRVTDTFTVEVYDPGDYYVSDRPNDNSTIELSLYTVFGESFSLGTIEIDGLESNSYISESWDLNGSKLYLYRSGGGSSLIEGTTTITIRVTDPADGPTKQVIINFYNDDGDIGGGV